jgi:hypothetical protein
METSKKPSTAKKKMIIDDSFIVSSYMDFCLENNHRPKNVFLFCKQYKITEPEFYSFYGNLDAIGKDIWTKFLENALVTLEKGELFSGYSEKNKLLSLYFTLFEILTLNRSYVLFDLHEHEKGLKNLKVLKEFRNQFKDFIVTIINDNTNAVNSSITRITKPLFSEGAWIQFLFLLRFWINDSSKGFEKTDVLIEKSVNTVVDLLETKPLENLIDLGKFLWKEKRN